jgi:GH15 family glucan-1,4-alpha-glucosidase
MSSRISECALIGNCETAALVSRKGAIDWMCVPRFDSPACFAALLGSPENGRWLLRPNTAYTSTRRYCRNTLILETRCSTTTGTVLVTDFMPVETPELIVIRIVRGIRGHVPMKMELVIRFDYGLTIPWVTRQADKSLLIASGPNELVLRAPVPLHSRAMLTISSFDVKAGETVIFELRYRNSFRHAPSKLNPLSLLRRTERFWREWASHCRYKGPKKDAVVRSLITLKALTCAPTGGMVAAPTTSLPERPGGARNWDYRYCWLRDATFTLLGFIHAGYEAEARNWKDWLLRSVAGSARQIKVLYGVAGERLMGERNALWLPGYERSTPVRIGNAASEQFQLDIFGELMDVLHHASRSAHDRSSNFGVRIEVLEHLQKVWRRPDHGIWEIRRQTRHFTHSKVMAWVAFDRAIRDAERYGFDRPLSKWKATRDEIHGDVCRFGFNPRLGTFVKCYGSTEVDGSLLLLPLVGFLPANDPRISGTVRLIEKRLLRGTFVMRSEAAARAEKKGTMEGAFLPCSFWLADYYELTQQRRKLDRMLEKLLAIRNDLGLLSEEYDVNKRRLLGNFPQALSHVAMVNTIINRYRPFGPSRQRSEGPEAQALL